MTPIAVLAMISARNGIKLVSLYDHSVDKYKFESSLNKLREKNPNQKICILLDNLSVHRSKVVVERAAKLGIPLIFNCPYYPESNPIELVFAKVKHEYKKQKLRRIVEGKKIYQKILITNAFKSVDKNTVNQCIIHARSHMERDINDSMIA